MGNEDREKQALAWLERLREATAGKQSLVEYCRRHGLRPGEARTRGRGTCVGAGAGRGAKAVDRARLRGWRRRDLRACALCWMRARCRHRCNCNCIWLTAVEPIFY